MEYPNLTNGLCREVGEEFFFPDKNDKETAAIAKNICKNCTVITECGDWAIKHEEFGIWGGLSTTDRKLLRRRNGIKLETILSRGIYEDN